ncbi:MAG TPA: hypothetical protein VJX67_27025 [Blastocatellia bacterium]|nr:hypothetical protein [Blastocatellia bacterium]
MNPLSRKQSLGLTASFTGIVLLYVWTAATSGESILPSKQNWGGYYGLLADAFLDGHLYLLVAPKPELLALPDPYDPAQNQRYTLHDAALFRGRFYLYYGPTPALLLFVPFRYLTGLNFPQPLAVALFCSMGLGFSFALFVLLARTYLRSIPYWLLQAALFGLGFGNVTAFILRRPLHYEIAIAAGYALVFAGLLSFAYGFVRGSLQLSWLALGSLLLGLAGGARVPLLAAGLVPVGIAVGSFATWRRGMSRNNIYALLALFGPLGACIFLLGLYNYLRFGSWTEFGMHYTLQGIISPKKYQFYSLARIPSGIVYYLLVPPFPSRRLPFFRIDPWAYRMPPPGYLLEPMIGVFSGAPFLAILGLAPWMSVRLWRSNRGLLWATAVLAAIGMVLVGLYCTTAGTMRYEVDFATFLLVPALLFWCYGLETWEPGRKRRVARATLLVLLASTIGFSLVVNVSGLLERLRQMEPRAYEAIDRPFRPLERLLGDNPVLLSPKPGETLSQPIVTFRWDSIPHAEDYWIDVGTDPGQGNIYHGFTSQRTSATINLRRYLTGQKIYVRLLSKSPHGEMKPGTAKPYEFSTRPTQ